MHMVMHMAMHMAIHMAMRLEACAAKAAGLERTEDEQPLSGFN
jgi:hypothetical protein